jgi:tetratricopeptide (TPR) repeat protein
MSSQTIEDIRDNIVKIVDKKGTFNGTGFFIEVDGRKYCLTCHHCICDVDGTFVENSSSKYHAEWVEKYSDMNKDIAVLAVKDCPIRALKNSKEAMGGLRVFVWGFPGNHLYHYPQGKQVPDCDLSKATFSFLWEEKAIKGVNKWNNKPQTRLQVFQIVNRLEMGFSGSPVCYGVTNQVVGMLTAKDNDYGYAIPIQTILEKFDANERNVVEPSPTIDTLYYMEKGNDSFAKGDYFEAIRQYDVVLKDPTYSYMWYNKGIALSKLRRHYESIQSYDNALHINPNYANTWFSRGVALDELDRHIEAIQCYNIALQIYPNFALAWNNKAKSLVHLGNYYEAIQCADRALELDPNLVIEWDNKAWALGNLKKYEESIECSDRALQVDPNFALAWHHKGWMLEKLDRYDEAKRCFEIATQLGYKG